MAKRKIEEIVAEFALPFAEENSFELVDVEFIKEGANWYLRIYIDKQNGITLDDCKTMSDEISKKLDELDPIEQSYILEVSSPGLDRPIKKEKDFVKYKGELVEVKLFKPQDGKKLFEGQLVGFIDGKVCIQQAGSDLLEFESEMVVSVKRVIKF